MVGEDGKALLHRITPLNDPIAAEQDALSICKVCCCSPRASAAQASSHDNHLLAVTRRHVVGSNRLTLKAIYSLNTLIRF